MTDFRSKFWDDHKRDMQNPEYREESDSWTFVLSPANERLTARIEGAVAVLDEWDNRSPQSGMTTATVITEVRKALTGAGA